VGGMKVRTAFAYALILKLPLFILIDILIYYFN
jgi:hypothetical protein